MCDSMGHLVKLVFMASDLGGNMPVDTLPMSLTSLQSLSTLDMSMNYVYCKQWGSLMVRVGNRDGWSNAYA